LAEIYHDIDDLDAYPEISQALANMVVAWSNAETMLSMTFAKINSIPLNQATMGFYRIPTFEAKTKVLLALAEDWECGTLDKALICQIIDRISAQAAARNKWIHGIWSRDATNGQIVVFQLRRPVGSGRFEFVRAQDIKSHTAALRENTTALGQAIKFDKIIVP
jgi:hypothetical protein